MQISDSGNFKDFHHLYDNYAYKRTILIEIAGANEAYIV
jgi:hypothetical protein